CQHYDSYPRTF
nr:immunoglobulin light chain junction region [Macaca mulatta]